MGNEISGFNPGATNLTDVRGAFPANNVDGALTAEKAVATAETQAGGVLGEKVISDSSLNKSIESLESFEKFFSQYSLGSDGSAVSTERTALKQQSLISVFKPENEVDRTIVEPEGWYENGLVGFVEELRSGYGNKNRSYDFLDARVYQSVGNDEKVNYFESFDTAESNRYIKYCTDDKDNKYYLLENFCSRGQKCGAIVDKDGKTSYYDFS
jgi:hypothetical protein